MTDNYHEPDVTEADFDQSWQELVQARTQSRTDSLELTWKAGCAAMDAAETAAGGPDGSSNFVNKTLRNLSDKTWGGATRALENLLEQVSDPKLSKSPESHQLRMRVVKSALDALDREMAASRSVSGRY